MNKSLLALLASSGLLLGACTNTPDPIVVTDTRVIALQLDENFFSSENCPNPDAPPVAPEGESVTQQDVSQYLIDLYYGNRLCRITINSIQDEHERFMERVKEMDGGGDINELLEDLIDRADIVNAQVIEQDGLLADNQVTPSE